MVCEPSAVGFNMADVVVMKNLPDVCVAALKALLSSPYRTLMQSSIREKISQSRYFLFMSNRPPNVWIYAETGINGQEHFQNISGLPAAVVGSCFNDLGLVFTVLTPVWRSCVPSTSTVPTRPSSWTGWSRFCLPVSRSIKRAT